MPFACWTATLVIATAWTWYQTAIYPFTVVVGRLDEKRISSLMTPPLSPFYLLVALIGAYSLCRTYRPVYQRLALVCLLALYSWTLAGMLDLHRRPTRLPAVLVTRTSEPRKICGLLVQESATTDKVWYAEYANGYLSTISRAEIQRVEYGPATDMLVVAREAAEDENKALPICPGFAEPFNLAGLTKVSAVP